jgi:inhibitor of KinA
MGDLKEKVAIIYSSGFAKKESKPKTWKIPVCYDEEFGIDLKEIAVSKKCGVKDIIYMHTSPKYLIYFTGFLPGFLYLGGLPATLLIPRRSSPRLQIIKGAVAIGGQQTGIYPTESPGGWNIIGNSPLEFFNPTQNPPCFSETGDYLKFYAIDRVAHQQIKKEVEVGAFEVESETE